MKTIKHETIESLNAAHEAAQNTNRYISKIYETDQGFCFRTFTDRVKKETSEKHILLHNIE